MLSGAATPEHAIPNFGGLDRPALDLSPGLLDITAVLDQLLPPVGAILPYAGAGGGEQPAGWLVCDGSAISRTTFAKLFVRIGVVYGAGDGATTFNLPDLRGRSIVHLGTNGAVNARNASDGVAVANRRGTLHRHTPHTHTIGVDNSANKVSSNNVISSAGLSVVAAQNPGTGASDGGSGVGTDPLDGGAYLVLQSIIRAS